MEVIFDIIRETSLISLEEITPEDELANIGIDSLKIVELVIAV